MKPQRRAVDLPNGDEFEFYMTPLTLAERARAQKQAKTDDATDFALQLLVSKARDENNAPLFNQGEIADLRNMLPASVVEALMLELIGEPEEEELELTDMKSASEPVKKDGQLLTELLVAEKLGKTLAELQEAMTPQELAIWIAYYNHQAQEQREVASKQRARRR